MKHKHAYLFVFSLLLAMQLVACGGGEEQVEEVQEAPPTEEEKQEPTEAPVEEAADSGSKIFTIAWINDSTDIDPRSNYDLGLATIAQQYETLT